MSQSRKKLLAKEAEQQLKAIKTIGRWRTIAIGISAIGFVLSYVSFSGIYPFLWLKICGILLILLGLGGAAVFNLGIKNGKNNVNKLIKEIEKK